MSRYSFAYTKNYVVLNTFLYAFLTIPWVAVKNASGLKPDAFQ